MAKNTEIIIIFIDIRNKLKLHEHFFIILVAKILKLV